MPPKAVNQLTPEHDVSLVPTHLTQALILRAITASVLASRRGIYATPGLEDVAGNGGSRVNQRVQQMLKKMCAAYGVAGVVEDEVAAASGKGQAEGGSVKEKAGKKRKVEVKDEDD